MPFTTESIDAAPVQSGHANSLQLNEFDLPVKEFVGYDPKGTMSVTGSPLVHSDPNVKQPKTSKEDKVEQEAPKSEESVKAEESVTLSPQISALARKEQAQRKREQAIALREKELESKLADAEKYSQLKQKIASKDYSAADELGLTYEEYTKYLVERQSSEDPTEKRYRKVEEELSTLKKNQEEQVIKEYQANQSLWKEEISKVISDPEKYPETAYWKSKGHKVEDAILQHVNDSFDEDKVELSAEQAAQEIEKYLVGRSEFLAESPTIKKKFQEPAKVLGPPKASSKTLTQNMTVTSQKTSTKPFHLMSESEQIAEAIRRVQAAKQTR